MALHRRRSQKHHHETPREVEAMQLLPRTPSSRGWTDPSTDVQQAMPKYFTHLFKLARAKMHRPRPSEVPAAERCFHRVAHGDAEVTPQRNSRAVCLCLAGMIERGVRERKLPCALGQQQRENALRRSAARRLIVAAVHENILAATVGVEVSEEQ